VGARISVQEDGTFLLQVGATDLGQGSSETFLNIAARALGVDRSQITLHMGDTRYDPQAGMTTASRITFVGGNATLQASQQLLSQVCDLVCSEFGVPIEAIKFQDGYVVRGDTGQQLISLADLAREKKEALSAEVVYEAPETQGHPEWAAPSHPRGPGAQACTSPTVLRKAWSLPSTGRLARESPAHHRRWTAAGNQPAGRGRTGRGGVIRVGLRLNRKVCYERRPQPGDDLGSWACR
jgi:hypothetical protein